MVANHSRRPVPRFHASHIRTTRRPMAKSAWPGQDGFLQSGTSPRGGSAAFVRATARNCNSERQLLTNQHCWPGRLAAGDFTVCNELGVKIAGQRFAHTFFHCVLTYSNVESVSLCFRSRCFRSRLNRSVPAAAGGSFELPLGIAEDTGLSRIRLAGKRNIQKAFWEFGGVPARHRSDSLAAAVRNHTSRRELTERYAALMSYYSCEAERTNARCANENGDVESSNGHLKDRIDQAAQAVCLEPPLPMWNRRHSHGNGRPSMEKAAAWESELRQPRRIRGLRGRPGEAGQ